MDVRFIARSSAVLFPLILAFSVSWYFHAFVGDYAFHASYLGEGDYPRGLAYILNALQVFIPRELALFLVALAVVLYLPFVLFFEITRSEKASWAYLYGSGVVLLLFFIWLIPQAIIHVFILASVRFRWFLIFFLLFGWFFHAAYLYAFALTVLYLALGGRHAPQPA